MRGKESPQEITILCRDHALDLENISFPLDKPRLSEVFSLVQRKREVAAQNRREQDVKGS